MDIYRAKRVTCLYLKICPLSQFSSLLRVLIPRSSWDSNPHEYSRVDEKKKKNIKKIREKLKQNTLKPKKVYINFLNLL